MVDGAMYRCPERLDFVICEHARGHIVVSRVSTRVALQLEHFAAKAEISSLGVFSS